jgi:hypothetical protein
LKAPSVDGIPIAPRAIGALLSSIGAITCANAVTEKSSIAGSLNTRCTTPDYI